MEISDKPSKIHNFFECPSPQGLSKDSLFLTANGL